MGKLTASERKRLPSGDFALPGKGEGPSGKGSGSYPIEDEGHAKSALSRVAQHGSPEEKAKVRAKVKRKYPGMKVAKDGGRIDGDKPRKRLDRKCNGGMN